ncbi:MAG TPA: hypothetical protein VF041_11000 [Gemmatimonadaceae bacterium]
MEDVLAFLVGLGGVAVILIGSYVAIKATNRIWGRGRPGAAGRASGTATDDLAALAGRLERMEHAIDAMSVEVERISEGQRFTTRLLAERAPAAPAGSRS